MISQRSSVNKKIASNDFKLAVKMMIIPSIFSFLVALYFFVIRVYSLFSLYFVRNDMEKTFSNIRSNVAIALTSAEPDVLFGVGTSISIYIGVFAIITGVLFALRAYSFLTHKKMVNVWLSAGINRSTIFKNRTLAAMLFMAVSSLIPIMIDVVMNVYYIGDAGYIIRHGVFLFLEYYAYMLVGFSMMSIAMMLCNTIIECLFFGAGFIWAPTVLITTFNVFCSAFLRGFSNGSILSSNLDESRSLLNITSIFNPVFFGRPLGNYNLFVNVFNFVCRGVKVDESGGDYYTNPFGNYGKEDLPFEYVLPVIIWLAVSAVFLLAARKLFLCRKAENAGLHGVKTFVNAFVAVEISMLASAVIVSLLSSMEANESDLLTVLAAMVIFALSYFVLMSISKRSVKHNRAVLMPAVSALCVMLLTTVILYTGAFGYTNRIPDMDNIEYATITSTAADASGNESPFTYTSYSTGMLFFNYYDDYDLGVFSDKEDLRKFTAVHKKVAEKTDNMTGNPVRIVYHLKDGSVMSRRFETTDETACYEILSLTDTDAYHSELEYLLSSKQKNDLQGGITKDYPSAAEYAFNYYGESTIKNMLVTGQAKLVSSDGIIKNDIENTDALRDAILADRLSMTYDQIYKPQEKPIGYVIFMDQKWYDTYSDYSTVSSAENTDEYYEGTDATVTFYIYPSMTNTMNYLRSTGAYSILKTDDSVERYGITSARVMKCSELRKVYSEKNYYEETVVGYLFARSGVLLNSDGSIISSADEYFDDTYEVCFKDGKEITDAAEIKALSDASRIFGYAENGDYIVYFKNDDGAGYTSLIREAELPAFAK